MQAAGGSRRTPTRRRPNITGMATIPTLHGRSSPTGLRHAIVYADRWHSPHLALPDRAPVSHADHQLPTAGSYQAILPIDRESDNRRLGGLNISERAD